MSYDTARAEYERQSSHKRGSYTSQRIAKRVNADVTPDVIKQRAQIGEGASIIVHYDNCAGFRGRLLGVLTVADGRKTSTIKVWDQPLHDQVQQLLSTKSRVVKVETKPSSKWGDALVSIVGVNTLPPDQVSDDHDSLMQREG
jgi:hypothetical protein